MLYSMPETGKRLLHVLARNVGRPLTVQDLADQTKGLHGRGYYANTYRELQRMKKTALIRWETRGKNALIQLEPNTPQLIDYLVQLEGWKRLWATHDRPDAHPRLESVALALLHEPEVEAAWLLEARRSIRLNRMPLLILYRNEPQADASATRAAAQKMETRLDLLPMSLKRLLDLFSSPREHPLRPWLADGIAILGADRHWLRWLHAARTGPTPWLTPRTRPPTEDQIVASLAHYGYEEFGASPSNATPMALEPLIVQLLSGPSARRRKAIGPLLEENEFDPALLLFLARREGLEGRLASAARRAKKADEPMRALKAGLLKSLTGG